MFTRFLISYLVGYSVGILTGSILLKSCRVEAAELRLLDVDEISIDMYKITGRRSAYQPQWDGKWTHGGQFNLDLRFAKYFSWQNSLHFAGTEAKLRDAGWQYRIMLDYWPVQPFYYHHSQHSLDETGAVGKFPIEDYIGLRFLFFQRKHK